MQIKKFKVKDIAEGLKTVRDEMGENALILSTHKLRHGNGIEVVAALDETPVVTSAPEMSATPPAPVQGAETGAQNYASRVYSQIGGVRQNRLSENGQQRPQTANDERAGMWKERIAAKQTEQHWRFGNLPPFLQKLRTAMLIAGIHTEIVDRIIGTLSVDVPQKRFEQAESAREVLSEVMQEYVSVAADDDDRDEQQKVIAMVGPTGVGKTTSIAKLASMYKFQQHKRVALISVDTFRIAAVEQLRVFAELAEMPLRVAYSPHQLGDVLSSLQEYDVVLIDTTGRNPKNRAYRRELQQFLEVADPAEIHLVLSATTRYAEQEDIIRSYTNLACNRILLTKIDEVMNPSILLNVHKLSAIPMAYLANGQNIPEDLIIAKKDVLGKLMAHSWDIEKWIN